jgi:1-acyl-sn-glycerol-3-phosphate acyltransferase
MNGADGDQPLEVHVPVASTDGAPSTMATSAAAPQPAVHDPQADSSQHAIIPKSATGPPLSAVHHEPPRNAFLDYVAYLWYSILYGPCFAISKAMFRFRYSGKQNVPIHGPVLIVSNHQSNLDPVLIGLACPRQLKYFARVGLFFWPFSWWIRALGAVPINRDNAIGGIKTTLRLLKHGEAVVVFPEGSRTPDGKVHDMLPGFCMLARKSGATIVPVAINGAYDALRRGRVIPRLARISLVICPRITPQEISTMTNEQLNQLVESQIAAALQRTILEESGQISISRSQIAAT